MKKGIYLVITWIILSVFSIALQAQNVLNGIYIPENIPTKKNIYLPHEREADIMWQKREWRIIDCREKINFPLYYPLQSSANSPVRSLWDIVKFHITERKDLTVYKDFNVATLSSFGGDQFIYPVHKNQSNYRQEITELISTLGPMPDEPIMIDAGNGVITAKILAYDASGSPIYAYPDRDTFWIETKDVLAWELKEDWFFDKQRSVLDVRIIGIAPLVQYVDPVTNQVLGYKRLFWLYFPELTYIIQNYFVFNRMNDAQRMSFGDLFLKRMFSSYVTKESNVYDRKIIDYTAGVDALLESERIQSAIARFEHDVWDL